MTFRKIGLALSGGGARGLAHIGVLQVFEEAGIPISVLSGTSMGGLIGAAYAAGFEITELEKRALALSHYRELVKLLDVSPLRRGLLEGNRVREYLTHWFGETITFDELKYPLALCATDLNNSQCVTLTSGNLLASVLATIAVPGLFAPVQIGSHHLVDGGVLNNLPVMAARDLGADLVIAVDVQISPTLSPPWQELPYKPKWPVPLPDFFLDLYRAGLIMVEKITQNNLEKAPPDLLIRPSIPEDITMFLGFPRAPEILEAGRVAAQSFLPQILSATSD